MRRSSRWSVAGFLIVALAACSENPNALKQVSGAKNLTITPTISLDQSVLQILSLYPKGLETAATTRWGNIKSKYAAGLTDPSQLVVAKQMLVDLTAWLNNKTPDMATPPNNETRPAATSRAVLYMSLYVYNGPTTPPPPYNPTADAVTGLVTPGAPATIVTPTTHAGVQLDAGSVAENTIIVITQNPTPYPANCSGPLQTRLCQYPQFYFFDMFPHATLLKPGKFNVCHVNSGDNRRPLADHDRFRLAHTAPTNAADYTPGSTIRNQNGESIEILPLVAQTFSTCVQGDDYPTGIIGVTPIKALSRFARGVQKFFTPKNAYAIDVGLGGLSRSLSPFNDVDPLGTPDLTVDSFTSAQASVNSGSALSVSYSVKNIGTATQDTSRVEVLLTPVVIEGTPVSRSIASFKIDPLPPQSSIGSTNYSVTIPSDVSPGQYQLTFTVDDNPLFPDANANNNSASVNLAVTSAITDLGALPGDNFAVAVALNESGHVVGFSSSDAARTARTFLWIDGKMTLLGDLGFYGGQLAINDSDAVVGVSQNADGFGHAVRWKNGQLTDLGTLPGTISSGAVSINLGGDIVGSSTGTNGGSPRGWIWRNGVMTDLGLPPGESDFEPTAINDVGQVVGYSLGSLTSWLWQNGTFSPLQAAGGSYAAAINNAGLVVGGRGNELAVQWLNREPSDLPMPAGDIHSYAEGLAANGRITGYSYPDETNLPTFVLHAVLWQGGRAITLPPLPGGVFAEAIAVNSTGRIVGQSTAADGRGHAVMWQAPPLP
jgi:probable HAF family extracellular repeat protein